MTGVLATAGLVGGGCTPEGRNLFGELAVYTAKEAISHEVNPSETNVYVDNSGNNSQESHDKSLLKKLPKKVYVIPMDYFYSLEPKDQNELACVRAVLSLDLRYAEKAKTEDDYVRAIKDLDLIRCPEEFKELFNNYIQTWEDYGFEDKTMSDVKQAWKKVLDEAYEKGLRKR